MRRALVAIGAALLVLGIGYRVSQDPEIQKLLRQNASAVGIVVQSPANTSVSRTDTAPAYATDYAQAFCDANVAAIAATTNIEGITGDVIAAYFASDTTACSAVRYLGAVNDGGAERHIFVLTYAEGREDYIILTFDPAHMATGLKRG